MLLRSIALLLAPAFVSSAWSAETLADLPDLSGSWGRSMLFFEPPASGPGPILNLVRKPDGSVVPADPCCTIVREWRGDSTSPILKPEAAEAVRKFAERSLSGGVTSDLHSNCFAEPPPYAMSVQFAVNILQQKNEIILIYLLHNTVRHVRLNASHPEKVTPSWQGDSVGWYDGDTLVVDTIGIKADPPSTVDAFGTPHTEALHVVERYRLIDGNIAAETQWKYGAPRIARENGGYGQGSIDQDTAKKGLQVAFTVEDAGVFTKPWSGTVTYRPLIPNPAIGHWPETICAEHPQFLGGNGSIPHADKPDF